MDDFQRNYFPGLYNIERPIKSGKNVDKRAIRTVADVGQPYANDWLTKIALIGIAQEGKRTSKDWRDHN